MTHATDIAKLRHLYANLVGGGVRDASQAKRIAEGLLAPVIESLERAAAHERKFGPITPCSTCGSAECFDVLPYCDPPPAADARMWGFFHTTCIHESASALVSLHLTKAGAWRAMRQAQWDAWEELRSQADTHMHFVDRDTRRWARRQKPYDGQHSCISPVEVLP